MKDSKSTSGYVFTLGGAAVSWKSSKQTCIARSTMESEFIALDKDGEKTEWLRNFLEDIPGWTKPVPAINVHCDNQSAIARAQNCMYNESTPSSGSLYLQYKVLVCSTCYSFWSFANENNSPACYVPAILEFSANRFCCRLDNPHLPNLRQTLQSPIGEEKKRSWLAGLKDCGADFDRFVLNFEFLKKLSK
ncbi:Ribonuclease H-like domain containing protein [Abeliophyllum distichum]|uniref:Ribonuclease H-like domain containing protein n=1 Tax=Abeliophyllum distichum TaxID=126358 RepID=A0ABD1VXG3_9LAMI